MLKVQYILSNNSNYHNRNFVNNQLKKNHQICFHGIQLERFSQVEKMTPETHKLADIIIKKFNTKKDQIQLNVQNYFTELKNVKSKDNLQINYSAKLLKGIEESSIKLISQNGKTSITNGERNTYVLFKNPDNIEILIAKEDGEIGISKRNSTLLCNKDLNTTAQQWLRELL